MNSNIRNIVLIVIFVIMTTFYNLIVFCSENIFYFLFGKQIGIADVIGALTLIPVTICIIILYITKK